MVVQRVVIDFEIWVMTYRKACGGETQRPEASARYTSPPRAQNRYKHSHTNAPVLLNPGVVVDGRTRFCSMALLKTGLTCFTMCDNLARSLGRLHENITSAQELVLPTFACSRQ